MSSVKRRRSISLQELRTKAKVLRNTLKNSLPSAFMQSKVSEHNSHSKQTGQNSIDNRGFISPVAKRQRTSLSRSSSLEPGEVLDTSWEKTLINKSLKSVVEEAKVKDVKAQPSFKKTRKEFKSCREEREEEGERTLFLGNLSLRASKQDVERLCSPFG